MPTMSPRCGCPYLRHNSTPTPKRITPSSSGHGHGRGQRGRLGWTGESAATVASSALTVGSSRTGLAGRDEVRVVEVLGGAAATEVPDALDAWGIGATTWEALTRPKEAAEAWSRWRKAGSS